MIERTKKKNSKLFGFCPSPANSPTGLSHITFLFMQARVRLAPPFFSSAQYSSKNDPLPCTCSTAPLFLFASPSVVIILFTFVIFFSFANFSIFLAFHERNLKISSFTAPWCFSSAWRWWEPGRKTTRPSSTLPVIAASSIEFGTGQPSFAAINKTGHSIALK